MPLLFSLMKKVTIRRTADKKKRCCLVAKPPRHPDSGAKSQSKTSCVLCGFDPDSYLGFVAHFFLPRRR